MAGCAAADDRRQFFHNEGSCRLALLVNHWIDTGDVCSMVQINGLSPLPIQSGAKTSGDGSTGMIVPGTNPVKNIVLPRSSLSDAVLEGKFNDIRKNVAGLP